MSIAGKENQVTTLPFLRAFPSYSSPAISSLIAFTTPPVVVVGLLETVTMISPAEVLIV
jgi:hypothetical protein